MLDARRLLVAALFVVGVTAAVGVAAFMSAVGDRAPLTVGLGLGFLFLLLNFLAVYLFNPWWADPLGRMTHDDLLRRLEAEGLLASADFQARRAFGVQEYDDEGLHYFVELTDGRVLYLSGLYI
jgi:hypothetical protein